MKSRPEHPPLKLEEKLRLLPDQPGIYRYYNHQGQIIYVGKAKNLKNRVRSYFVDRARDNQRLENLIASIRDLDWVITHNELEALILEDRLIKAHQPRYNVMLKDDKTYPYFRLTLFEMFPRLELVRKIKRDGALYFGPYVNVGHARTTWKIIKRHFPLRQSSMPLDGSKTYRPCLNYQMHKCLAPCAGKVSPQEYGQLVRHVVDLLKGNYEDLLKELEREMQLQAQRMFYEQAAEIRDQITAIKRTLERQRVVSPQKLDRDVLALVREGGFAGVQVLFVRGGLLLSDDFFFFKEGEKLLDEELLRSSLSRLYLHGDKHYPKEVLLPQEAAEQEVLQEYCTNQAGFKVSFVVPQRGEKKALVDLAQKNAQQNLALRMKASKADELVLAEVKQVLKLKNLPQRVECFDISHISGSNNVASMVVWDNNQASRKDYRKFKIKEVEGSNDFAAMQEVLTRRYKRVVEEGQALPDLILIDGGKGQLSAALAVLEGILPNLDQVDVIGLAKGRSEKRREEDKGDLDYEYVVKPNQKNQVVLKKNSSTLHFMQNIRDEAHRFAITFHRAVRGKKALGSQLDSVPGIGPTKKKALLTYFKGVTRIKGANLEELQSVPGLSPADARRVFEHFRPAGTLEPESQAASRQA